MRIIISFLFCLFIYNCGIEEKIDDAISQCENKILKLLETVEETCLTKEEILLLISATKNVNIGPDSYCTEAANEIQ
jgi:hypothetical protein